eukprot:CAMPEP_0114344524 /NCGR_PEP_ID=MMETSP0101-20121206/11487_1 /TAXON_ID=38822 ORGANISM="Pteridomonas danica, Strain PT" /NCGR_SAMPLE_ID=MMETSP0101 /ASSEMBLY_ACC=CAM_ASM_000211 /LENGTH=75 /DNA_ID=CAMNT_0001479921 /DNA_START=234 /DNA_END=461 /DNA_ORIENTATION=+
MSLTEMSLTERSIDSSLDGDASTFDQSLFNANLDRNKFQAKPESEKFEVMKGARGSVRVSSVSSTNSDDMNLPPV